jgi:alkylation response protein AidB-like acyl-CoA dehydrogenase
MNAVRDDFFGEITRFAPGIAECVTTLRRESGFAADPTAFPGRTIQRLSVYEQETPECVAFPLRYYVALAFGCLTTAFVMTQRHAAIRRLETSSNPRAQTDWLPRIRSGDRFATVGISHLTTSRRHCRVPPVLLRQDGSEWRLHGSVPWVTGAPHAAYIVVGAVDEQNFEREYLLLVELPNPCARTGAGMRLLALTNSCTDVVDFSELRMDKDWILHGPCSNVMAASNTGGAGGLQTSALALGLAASAIEYLVQESVQRNSLFAHAVQLHRTWQELYARLTSETPGDGSVLRKQANDLALQSTQAALAAAKGAGFVDDHPVGRWAREALFFLVWSCPQTVADAHLCSFSGVDGNIQ